MTPAPGALAGTELEDASRSPTAGDTGTVGGTVGDTLAADFPCPSSPRSPGQGAALTFSWLRLKIKIFITEKKIDNY